MDMAERGIIREQKKVATEEEPKLEEKTACKRLEFLFLISTLTILMIVQF